MSAEGIGGIAVGLIAIVAPEWVPKIRKGARDAITTFGFLLLGYSGILALEEFTGMKVQHGPWFLIVGGAVIAAIGVFWHIHMAREAAPATIAGSSTSQYPQGGKGGSGEIFGKNGTIIGGKGGDVGPGGVGRGGDGGGGIIHGDGGVIIGGEGGSVDGTNIWFPPAQSGYIQYLESHGQTPDFGVQYPGAGGATGGWLQRQQIVVKIREEYFKKTGQEDKIRSSKIEDVPLEYINEKLKEAGYPWRARIEKKYWYLYFVPSVPQEPAKKEFTDLTLQEFYAFYQGRNAIQAAKLAEPYVGLWVRVAGEIVILNPDGPGAVVWLKQDAASAECRFGEQWVRDLSRRKLGDHLKVIGKIKTHQPNGILYLGDCELDSD